MPQKNPAARVLGNASGGIFCVKVAYRSRVSTHSFAMVSAGTWSLTLRAFMRKVIHSSYRQRPTLRDGSMPPLLPMNLIPKQTKRFIYTLNQTPGHSIRVSP